MTGIKAKTVPKRLNEKCRSTDKKKLFLNTCFSTTNEHCESTALTQNSNVYLIWGKMVLNVGI